MSEWKKGRKKFSRPSDWLSVWDLKWFILFQFCFCVYYYLLFFSFNSLKMRNYKWLDYKLLLLQNTMIFTYSTFSFIILDFMMNDFAGSYSVTRPSTMVDSIFRRHNEKLYTQRNPIFSTYYCWRDTIITFLNSSY